MPLQALNHQLQRGYNYKAGGLNRLDIWIADNRHNQTAAQTLTIDTFTATDAAVTASIEAATGYPADLVAVVTHADRSKMTVNATQEKGLMLYTVTLELTFDFDAGLLQSLNSFRGKALGAKVVVNSKNIELSDEADTSSQTAYLVGMDAILGFNDGGNWYSDFALFLDSVEADTGSKVVDGTTCTAKFTAVQGTPPAVITET